MNNHMIIMDIQEIYDKQLRAITEIAHTNWYKEIKNYWKREVESIKQEYPTVKEDKLYRLQERDKIASAFLTFLENLENARNINRSAKV